MNSPFLFPFRKIGIILLYTALIVCVSSCMIFRTARFAQCTFHFKEVTQLEGVGVDLKGKSQLSSLNFKQGTRISRSLLKKKMPMNITVALEVQNPNSGLAAMSRVDWILVLKGKEVLRGSNDQRVSVPGNGGKALLPLTVQFDLFEALKGESPKETRSFLWKLTKKTKDPNVFTVKLKPHFYILKKEIPYPGYVNIRY